MRPRTFPALPAPGRYGVGMTDALCKLAPRAEIETLHDGALSALRVDWEECLRNSHFPFLADRKPRRAMRVTRLCVNMSSVATGC